MKKPRMGGVLLITQASNQAAEMLSGAAGKLVGIGSGWPSAMALARLYMKLSVAPWASMAAATTAQLRTSVDIVNEQITTTPSPRRWVSRGSNTRTERRTTARVTRC